MGFSLFGVKFSDMCLDMSNTALDRSSLTSIVMLISLSTLGGVALMGLTIRMERQLPGGNAFHSGPSVMD